jgi:hypothetical protein
LELADQEGFTLDELIEAKRKWTQEPLRKCPKCKAPMHLNPVNTGNTDQVGGNFKCQWLCTKCWYDEYSIMTLTEEYEKAVYGEIEA